MQFRIQFLDGSARVIHELYADARNAVGAVALVADVDWPPRAVRMRVLDLDGREVHSKVKGDTRSWRLCGARGSAGVSVAQTAVDGGFAQGGVIAERLGERVGSTRRRLS